MYVFVATQEEHDALYSKNPPKWKGEDMAVSPGIAALPSVARDDIADLLDEGDEFGADWTLCYDQVSAADWPERFAAGIARCIAELRKA